MGLDDIIGTDYPHDIIGGMATGYDGWSHYGADIMTGAAAAQAAMVPSTHPFHMGMAHTQHPAGVHPAVAQQMAMNALKMRHAAALAPRPMMKSREYAIGFQNAPVAIAAAVTTVLRANPQVPFKGRRLIIPSDVAGALTINSFVIGKNPVLVSADPVSARAFTEIGVGVDLNMDTAQIAQVISLSMTNNSGASVSVTPTLIGTAIE